eukprot:TRINITY_DN2948_c0_g1_i5.p1 TRINITY_DN2948_c0_g1~~TRINITY_DN2948_c0_g1_i5.p1  ORF type:complete len:239 (+),score=46.52 TRINITY_DN2948_c0_g1_i5:394-1110(+)
MQAVVSTQSTGSRTMLRRTFFPPLEAENRKLVVLQFNTLADKLSDAFPHSDPAILKWTFRSQHLVNVILEHDPDVVGLEEVDHFDDYFAPLLREKGYEGTWKKKPSDSSHDGVCLFWKTSKFIATSISQVQYHNSNQVAILAKLVNTHDQNSGIVVVVTHLKAKNGFEKDREAQGKELLSLLENFKKSTGGDFPAVICCDLNDVPGSLVYSVVNSRFDSAYVYLFNSKNLSLPLMYLH